MIPYVADALLAEKDDLNTSKSVAVQGTFEPNFVHVEGTYAARREMEAKGVLFIGPVYRSSGGYSWSHFFAPDGHVYEITSRS